VSSSRIAFITIIVLVAAFLLNSLYYMYYHKETVAVITDIQMTNRFTLFLPVDRYAVTLISTEEHFQPQKSISGRILLNGNHLSSFDFCKSDINIGSLPESSTLDRRPNKPYPETHDILGYYYLRKICDFRIEDRNPCTLEIVFDSVQDNIFLKIETYMMK